MGILLRFTCLTTSEHVLRKLCPEACDIFSLMEILCSNHDLILTDGLKHFLKAKQICQWEMLMNNFFMFVYLRFSPLKEADKWRSFVQLFLSYSIHAMCEDFAFLHKKLLIWLNKKYVYSTSKSDLSNTKQAGARKLHLSFETWENRF